MSDNIAVTEGNYFNGGDGNPIVKGDTCMWGNDPNSLWIIMGDPAGINLYDSDHPDSDYMVVWAKPVDCPSKSWNRTWVRRKTKGFTKVTTINNQNLNQ
jgi:hypothetical protein